MKLEKKSLIWRKLNCTDVEKQARREQVRMWVVSVLAVIMMFVGLLFEIAFEMKGNTALFLSICGLVVLFGNNIMFEIKMSLFSILKELHRNEQS